MSLQPSTYSIACWFRSNNRNYMYCFMFEDYTKVNHNSSSDLILYFSIWEAIFSFFSHFSSACSFPTPNFCILQKLSSLVPPAAHLPTNYPAISFWDGFASQSLFTQSSPWFPSLSSPWLLSLSSSSASRIEIDVHATVCLLLYPAFPKIQEFQCNNFAVYFVNAFPSVRSMLFLASDT